ncbi:endolytic transglycosylase MltG [Agromyces sp. SYSU T00194]|uniref:endolytic transglycosylase MltG n=1 Tax=Agromyces chitinivorans TaxID=3158560 RepID=UPI00339203B7
MSFPPPSDGRDSRARHDDGLDWDHVLTGVPGGGRPAPPPAPEGGEAPTGRPMTRREAREAEAAAAAAAARGRKGSGSRRDAREAATGPQRTPAGQAAPQRNATPSSGAQRRPANDGPAGLEFGDAHETAPPRRRGGWGCLIVVLIIVGALVGGYFAVQAPLATFMERFEPAPDYSGAGTGELVFMIEDGDTGEDIAANLHDQGVTASFDAFYELILEQNPVFYPGAYQLAAEMSAQAALDALLDEANRLENTFVITEGMWADNALSAAAQGTGIPVEDLEAAASDPAALGLPDEATTVEGFLFPATYTFGPDATAEEVVRTLVDRQFQALDEAGVAPEDRWETIIIASMLEREAGLRDDYYKVSRVIRNRLSDDSPTNGLLQFDSTVHYGIGEDGVITTTDAERADASNPYNSYVHPGLPPGPIGNPGDLGIDAALHPADGTWVYFVTVNLDTGETVFSTTLAEHEAAVAQYQAWLRDHPEYGG